MHQDDLHVFANPVKTHNLTLLADIDKPLYIIDDFDKLPADKSIPEGLIIAAQNRSQQNTGRLAKQLQLKIGARAMLTANIDVSDKRINGLMGFARQFKISHNSVRLVYIEFDCKISGKNRMKQDALA